MNRYRHAVKEVYDDYIVDIYGSKFYHKDNYFYKEIDNFGDVYYYNESGQLHRLDGPAMEWGNGNKLYYINGVKYFYEDWCEKVKEL